MDEDKWDFFWKKLNELSVWNWKSRYEIEDDNILVEGDMWKLKVSIGSKKIDSSGWCTGPDSLNEFFKILKGIVGWDISKSYYEIVADD